MGKYVAGIRQMVIHCSKNDKPLGSNETKIESLALAPPESCLYSFLVISKKTPVETGRHTGL